MIVMSRLTQVWHGAQGIVEAVREIRSTNYKRQLDDLPVIEKFAQLCERALANCRGTPGDTLGI